MITTGSEGAAGGRAVPTLHSGDIIAEKYRLERLLGKGGMADVYAALNLRTDKRVALKWIHPALASTEEGRARFRREALAAGRIHHPNVVTIFDVVEHEVSTCLIMELLEGETLARRLARRGRLPLIEAVALILPAMRGVGAAHAQGVIHRDLKPDNIFLCLDADGSVRDCKVLDFGVSKLASASEEGEIDITITGNLVGTPAYMAPEQVRGSRQVDRRADVYALGVVLYEMLAGRPPFVGEIYSAVMIEIATSEPPPVTRFRPEVPRRLGEVLHRALERDPDRRFPDVPSFIGALEQASREELNLPVGTPPDGLITQMGASRPGIDGSGRTLRVSRPRTGRRAYLLATVAVAVAAAAVVLWRGVGSAGRVRPAAAERRLSPVAPPPAAQPGPAAAAPPAAEPRPAPPARPDPTADQAPSRPFPARRAGGRAPGQRGASRANRAERDATGSAIGTAPAATRPSRAGKLSVDDF